MKKWKLGALALIFFLLLVSLFVVTSSDDSQEQNTNVASLAASSDDLVYTEVYTTTGSGSSAVTTLTSYTVSASNINISGSLVIPETYRDLPISGILANGFKDCTKLTEITIPSKCVNIGANAFANCISLTKIYYNVQSTAAATYTEESTPWLNCGSEVTLVLGNAVIRIGNYNFAYFTNLKEVIGGPSVTGIGDYAFYECTNLIAVSDFPVLVSIGSSVFQNCSSLKQVIIGSSVTAIGTNAFSGCLNLAEINYNAKAWSQTSVLTDATSCWIDAGKDVEGGLVLHIGSDVASLSYYAFYGLTHASTVICDSASYSLISLSSSGAAKIYPFETVGSAEDCVTLIISDITESIGGYAFYNFVELEKIEIGKSLKTISTTAFNGCTNLNYVYYNAVGDSKKYISYSEKSAPFLNAGTDGWTLKIGPDVEIIPQYQFMYATYLTEVDVSDASSLREILSYAFEYCTSLKSITIPETVELMGSYAVAYCSSIESIYYNAVTTNDNQNGSYTWFNSTGSASGLKIYIGESVQSLGKSAFRGVSNLSTVYYNTNTNVVKIFTANDNPFIYLGTLNSEGFNLIIGDNVTQIPRYAFYGATSLKSVSLTPDVESIGSNAFKGCTMLTDVSVAKNTKIEFNAFEDNLQLSYVDTVTVHFNSNGGSELKDKYLLIGNKLIKPEDPIREGYNFAGWYTNLALTKEYNFDNPVTENITLYANWSNVNDDPVTDDPIKDKTETNYTWILWVIVILIALYLIFGGRK